MLILHLFPHLNVWLCVCVSLFKHAEVARCQNLTTFCFVCRDIGCDLYVDHYCRDLPELMVIGSHATTVSLTQGIKNMTYIIWLKLDIII